MRRAGGAEQSHQTLSPGPQAVLRGGKRSSRERSGEVWGQSSCLVTVYAAAALPPLETAVLGPLQGLTFTPAPGPRPGMEVGAGPLSPGLRPLRQRGTRRALPLNSHTTRIYLLPSFLSLHLSLPRSVALQGVFVL